MNYSEFYINAKRRSLETLLSMWSSGNKEYQAYFKRLLETDEPLFAEPVFQTTFPWEPADRSFGELSNIFSSKFINALDAIVDEDFKFPKERLPYLHQLKSWDALLNQKKSIVVTSGTGSGKTECFMMPVLQDLMQNRESNAVQAIFIYPLNALIASQKKRMNAWSKGLGNIRYGIYNGKTPDSANSDAKKREFPEIICRKDIRETPPQILFSNPTMLEYMMVRGKDQSILNKSQGKLRWILLDEAHTYTGSAAAELALLIRRILNAFGVTPDQVRFAATSATMGDSNAEKDLKKFMAGITGQKDDQITIIGGKRIIPPLNKESLPSQIEGKKISPDEIEKIRLRLFKKEAIKARDLVGDTDMIKSIEFIDDLSKERKALLSNGDDAAILPTRGNFFARSVGGVSVCLNPNCKENKPQNSDVIGALSSLSPVACSCGAPLFELVRCNRCNEFLALGEYKNEKEDKYSYRAKKLNANESLFDPDEDENVEIGDDEIEDTQEDQNQEWSTLVLAKKTDRIKQETSQALIKCQDGNYSLSLGEGELLSYNSDNPSVCPCCGANEKYFRHFRFGNSFFNRMLSYTLLEQAPGKAKNKDALWKGKKYISFTDSRQGTAKNALSQNIDMGRIWIQSRVFHFLCDKRTNNVNGLRSEEEAQLDKLKSIPGDMFKDMIDQLESRKKASSNPDYLPSPTVTWKELYNFLKDDYESSREIHAMTIGDASKHLSWLLLDQFSRRPKYANSPENLGLIRCVYPSLKDRNAPIEFKELNADLTDADWQDYLKICIDFYLRENLFIEVPEDVKKLRTSKHFFNKRIYPSNSELPNVKRWPQFRPNGVSRLVILLCSAAGWDDSSDISKNNQDLINKILHEAFKSLIAARILIGGNDNGYAMQLEEAMAFEVLKEAYLCPVTNKPIDVQFQGYSPRINGKISKDNFENYKIPKKNKISYPTFPYANRKNKLGDQTDVDKDLIYQWLSERFSDLKDKGLWTNIHEQMFIKPELYLSAEHSAQQTSDRLANIEKDFEDNKLNILSCSTTMEMGVDIGGISEVVMNNVPPNTANYLQRAGRAGRRNESKSLALTFCGANPIGRNVMDNPLWPMTNRIPMPQVRFESPAIIQRHLNSFLFSKFITNLQLNPEGLALNETVEGLFGCSDLIIEKDYISDARIKEFFDFLIDLKLNDNSQIDSALKRIVNNTSIASKSKIDIIENCENKIKDVVRTYVHSLNKLNESLFDLRERGDDDSPAIKAVNYKKTAFIRKHLLGFLAEKQFLPNANMPTGVVDFDLTNSSNIRDRYNRQKNLVEKNSTKSIKSENPSLHIARALSDYAPGRQSVIDENCYTSEGIILNTAWKEKSILRVSKCENGHTIKTSSDVKTCHCGKPLKGLYDGTNGSYTEVIEPAGFSVDYNAEPTKVIDNDVMTIVDTELVNANEWVPNQVSNFCIETRLSTSSSEIMYYNSGSGFGYAVCTHCGRAEKEEALKTVGDNKLLSHKRLSGKNKTDENDRVCSGCKDNAFGIRRNVLLTGSIHTDFVEIRLKHENAYVKDKTLLRSLGIVFTQELTNLLGVNQSEIEFNIKKYKAYYSIYLFDTNKGGAGYSNQFQLYLYEILDAAFAKLKNCDCAKACTKCLVDRYTQWHLDELDRKVAIKWLKYEKKSRMVLPANIKAISSDAHQLTRDINSEIVSLISDSNISEMTFLVPGNTETWDIDNWKLVDEVKKQKLIHKKNVNFVLTGEVGTNIQDYHQIVSLKSWANVFEIVSDKQPVIMPIVLLDDCVDHSENKRRYFSIEANNTIDENWGMEETVFWDRNIEAYDFKPLVLPDIIGSKMEIVYLEQKRISSKQIFNLFFAELSAKNTSLCDKIKKSFSGKAVTINYSDRFIVSKQSAILMFQFIEELVASLDLEVEHLQLNFEKLRNKSNGYQEPRDVWHNWLEDRDRSFCLDQLMGDYYCINPEEIQISYDKQPHYRHLVIESDSNILTIQPDGGISQGWNFDSSNEEANYEDFDVASEIPLYNSARNLGKGIQYTISLE